MSSDTGEFPRVGAPEFCHDTPQPGRHVNGKGEILKKRSRKSCSGTMEVPILLVRPALLENLLRLPERPRKISALICWTRIAQQLVGPFRKCSPLLYVGRDEQLFPDGASHQPLLARALEPRWVFSQ